MTVDDDPVGVAARATAQRLAASYGPGLAADVEAVLAARETPERPAQYIDPVSVGSLIVSVATLAWSVYTGRKKETPRPSADVIARQIHAEYSEYDGPGTEDITKTIDIVVTEISRPHEHSEGER